MKNGNCEIAKYLNKSGDFHSAEYYSHDRCQRMESLIIPFSYDRDQPHQSFVIADRVRSRWLVGRYGNIPSKLVREQCSCVGHGSGFSVVRYVGISNIESDVWVRHISWVFVDLFVGFESFRERTTFWGTI